MFLRPADIVSEFRQVIVDYQLGQRLGTAWTDDQILDVFTTNWNEVAQQFAHNGWTFALTGQIDYVVYGETTSNITSTTAIPGSVLFSLPPDCIYVCSVGWQGLNVPVLHIPESEATADSLKEFSRQPVALFLPNGPALRLTIDFTNPVSLPQYIVVSYLRRLPDQWWVSSATYPYPVSSLLYWVVFAKTLIYLFEPDSGYLKVPYSPSLAPIEQFVMIGNRADVLKANGRLRMLRPAEAR